MASQLFRSCFYLRPLHKTQFKKHKTWTLVQREEVRWSYEFHLSLSPNVEMSHITTYIHLEKISRKSLILIFLSRNDQVIRTLLPYGISKSLDDNVSLHTAEKRNMQLFNGPLCEVVCFLWPSQSPCLKCEPLSEMWAGVQSVK